MDNEVFDSLKRGLKQAAERKEALDALEFICEGDTYEDIGRCFERAWHEHHKTIYAALTSTEDAAIREDAEPGRNPGGNTSSANTAALAIAEIKFILADSTIYNPMGTVNKIQKVVDQLQITVAPRQEGDVAVTQIGAEEISLDMTFPRGLVKFDSEGAKCLVCGAWPGTDDRDLKKCECGAENPYGANFCGFCGHNFCTPATAPVTGEATGFKAPILNSGMVPKNKEQSDASSTNAPRKCCNGEAS